MIKVCGAGKFEAGGNGYFSPLEIEKKKDFSTDFVLLHFSVTLQFINILKIEIKL